MAFLKNQSVLNHKKEHKYTDIYMRVKIDWVIFKLKFKNLSKGST